MRRSLLATVSALALSVALLAPVPPAHAVLGIGDIVFDPTNLAQNIITAANTITMISNQIEQLAHEAEMLVNMAKDLEALPFSVAADLQAALAEVDALIRRAEGIAYQVDAIEGEYQRLYPEHFAPGTTTAEIIGNAQESWSQARVGYKHALQIQAETVNAVAADAPRLDALIAESQAAMGNLQVAQAGNQLTALAAKQSMQLQTLLAAQSRAESLDRAHALAEKERGRARLEQFLGDGTAYTAGP